MFPRVLNLSSRLLAPRPLLRSRFNGFHASGLVLFSLWGAVCVATSRLYLDSEESPECTRKSGTSPESRTLLALEKSLNRFKLPGSVDIDTLLRSHEQTCTPGSETGISRYDIAQFASNAPIEDDHAEANLQIPSGHWSFFAVLDGHSGWETSAWLRENLIPATSGALADLFSEVRPSASLSDQPLFPTSEEIEQSIKDTFMRLDDDIVHRAVEKVFSAGSRTAAVNLLAPAYAGSCALLAFYDSHSRILRVALTGDSRAVLGRPVKDKHGNTVYEVHALTVEQDGHNLAEECRLNAHHPGEAVVINGRVLGMGPSRAFGDAMYKWSKEVQWKLKQSYLGRTPPANIKTPPYLTAEPEVTSIEVRPGDFLILATDGLWECLTSEDAVGLVGMWLNARNVGSEPTASTSPVRPRDLPIQQDEDEDDGDDTSVRYRQWRAEKQFVNLDKSAATHLLRNALGGADEDLARALLSLRAPRARTFIDDITATVVFFTER